jgi:hypothetical protein
MVREMNKIERATAQNSLRSSTIDGTIMETGEAKRSKQKSSVFTISQMAFYRPILSERTK